MTLPLTIVNTGANHATFSVNQSFIPGVGDGDGEGLREGEGEGLLEGEGDGLREGVGLLDAFGVGVGAGGRETLTPQKVLLL